MLAYQGKKILMGNECYVCTGKKGHVNIKPVCTGFDKTLQHLSDLIMHIISNIQWHLDICLTIETF